VPELPTDPHTAEFHSSSELFLVRLWLEDLGQGRSEWRGKVQHVLSGEVRYFRDWPGLVTCIQEKVGNQAADTGVL
jgi:hypothetical protein